MITPIDALFNYAQDRRDLTRWLRDEDVAKDYTACLRYGEEQEKELSQALDGELHQLFERYVENVDERHMLERQMMFCQGLAVGLQLGVRACF